jgi:hypothetical protein
MTGKAFPATNVIEMKVNLFLVFVLSPGVERGSQARLMVEISTKHVVKELCNFICKKIL